MCKDKSVKSVGLFKINESAVVFVSVKFACTFTSAPLAIPFSFVRSKSVKSFVDNPLPVTVSTFPARAVDNPDILFIDKLSKVVLFICIKSTISCKVSRSVSSLAKRSLIAIIASFNNLP